MRAHGRLYSGHVKGDPVEASTLQDDRIVLQTYIERFAVVFRTRLVSVTALALALAVCVSPTLSIQYGVVHFALYGLYMLAVGHARRQISAPGAFARLRWRSAVIGGLIAFHGAWLAWHLDSIAPALHTEAVLLAMTLFILAGLQVHLSNIGFLVAVTPPLIILGLLTRADNTQGALTTHLWAGGVFCFAMLASAWRQYASDRQSAAAAAVLAHRNAELQTALTRAEAASRAKTDLLACTSHEVRTPLNAVMTMAAVLAREASSPRHLELARGVEAAGGMLTRLLNGVLDFTRQEPGMNVLRPERIDVAELLSQIAAVWRPKCDQAGLILRIEPPAPPSDPAHGDRAWILDADLGRVEQTIVNLVANAVKFTPRGSEILVRAQARLLAPDADTPPRAALRFEVVDGGPGVSEADRERIFEAYEQTGAGRLAGGAGLGLAICRRNMELIGGRIGYEARPRDDTGQGGSIFWIEFEAPLTAPAASTPARLLPPAARPLVPAQPAGRRLRILAAEDNPANREVLRLIFEMVDVGLDMVENGQEAVEAAARSLAGGAPYDIILMDANMPVLDGVEAVREIRAAEAAADRDGSPARRTPIAMVTANVFDEDIARYLEAGADQVVPKPIEVRALLTCIDSLTALVVEPASGRDAAA